MSEPSRKGAAEDQQGVSNHRRVHQGAPHGWSIWANYVLRGCPIYDGRERVSKDLRLTLSVPCGRFRPE